jgi:hypothetical protein
MCRLHYGVCSFKLVITAGLWVTLPVKCRPGGWLRWLRPVVWGFSGGRVTCNVIWLGLYSAGGTLSCWGMVAGRPAMSCGWAFLHQGQPCCAGVRWQGGLLDHHGGYLSGMQAHGLCPVPREPRSATRACFAHKLGQLAGQTHPWPAAA